MHMYGSSLLLDKIHLHLCGYANLVVVSNPNDFLESFQLQTVKL